MPHSNTTLLVTTDWLADHLTAPDIKIVDASWYLPQMGRNARAEYDQGHIPEAVFFDVDEICDLDASAPHMLPKPEKFASRMRKMGIGDGNRVIIYDGAGLFSAARVWWMFRAMGHEDVAVLDGGLPKWKAEERPLDDMAPLARERHYTARLNNLVVRDMGQMLRNVETKREQVIDARAPGRFDGSEPEPREGMKSGHIPGAINLPFPKLLNEDKTMKSGDELRALFGDLGLAPNAPTVTSCGSGVTAAVVYLGLSMAGYRNLALYDGSWSEWGAQENTPVET
jgi:thiosulfate/3-mercaptopyruvate sulfurtransferase